MLIEHNKGIVIATDHFVERDDENYLLREVLKDSEVQEIVTGLWVPRHVAFNGHLTSNISRVAMGAGLTGYDPSRNREGDDEVKPQFRMIFDTSSSNSIEDTIPHIRNLMQKFPGPEMVFTLSPDMYRTGVNTLQQEFAGENVKFLLTGIYPEHVPEDIQELHDKDEAEYTKHLSEMVDKWGLYGLVGFGALARHTRVGQYYLGLGVCGFDALDYPTEVGNREINVHKRLTTPEITYEHATNTEIALGRTLFKLPNGDTMLPDDKDKPISVVDYRRLTGVVSENIKAMAERLNSLSPPKPIE